MLTYTTLDGVVLDLSDLAPGERAHFDRCYAAYRDGLPFAAFQDLVTGGANPLLAATYGRVTPAVWDHPLFRAIRDLEDRVGIRQGELAPEPNDDPDSDPMADAWLATADAARSKGVTVPGLHQAIRRGVVIARPDRAARRRLLVSANSLARWVPNGARQAAGRKAARSAVD